VSLHQYEFKVPGEGMKLNHILLIVIIFLVLSACTEKESTEISATLPPLSPPSEGLASVTGQVIHKETQEPFVDTIVRLAEVVRTEEGEDVFVLDQAFSPGAKTDETGIFVFEDVDPMEYVIVVGDVTGIYEIIPDDDGKPKVFTATPDEILEVGSLMVKLEPTQP